MIFEWPPDRKKSWAEVRREEEEDLTSARGSY
jgi:hypothetical protein